MQDATVKTPMYIMKVNMRGIARFNRVENGLGEAKCERGSLRSRRMTGARIRIDDGDMWTRSANKRRDAEALPMCCIFSDHFRIIHELAPWQA